MIDIFSIGESTETWQRYHPTLGWIDGMCVNRVNYNRCTINGKRVSKAIYEQIQDEIRAGQVDQPAGDLPSR